MGGTTANGKLTVVGAAVVSFVALALAPYLLEVRLGVRPEVGLLAILAAGLLLLIPQRTRKVGAGILLGAVAAVVSTFLVLAAVLPE